MDNGFQDSAAEEKILTAPIKGIMENSIAGEMDIEPGDILYSINGHEINDILDYEFYSQEDNLLVEIEKANSGELWVLEIEKEYDEELGLLFDGLIFDKMKLCQNRCLFCFVDQLPRKMRKTLYVKDDDYRYSFLLGNFISLTNLSEKDWHKILSMRLSPLYVSIHCMQPELRARLFNNPRAANIKSELKRLQEAGIEVHTQIVLCPGINDAEVLQHSINELAQFFPTVASVGVVPVGLSGHRQGLPPLRGFTVDEAIKTIELVDSFQDEFRPRLRRGFVYAADEFYLKAGRNFPPALYYDDYCQVENGIGLARIFVDDFAEIEASLPLVVERQEVYLITGVSAGPVLEKVVSRLNRIEGLELKIIRVTNRFFGGGVTVTGLLTGADIIATLSRDFAGKKLIIPEIVFKEGQDIMLDDTSREELEEKTGAEIITVDGSARSLVRTVLSLTEV
ncbi:DUF512 domain-containing protein [Syntrophomonas wolfei]|uniref:DUF512 domain-containing protein n=1 Tax=Syntrophomonas wolfei TaxID=863 RepID=UPI0007743E9F|nr:DUF512 domain-containing protein [Syntrophomonas wolfei]